MIHSPVMRMFALLVCLLVACSSPESAGTDPGPGAAVGAADDAEPPAGDDGADPGGGDEGEGEAAPSGDGGGQGEGEGEPDPDPVDGPDQPADCPEGSSVPPPVAEQVGVYDAQRQLVVMVGGDEGSPIECRPNPQGVGDTWIFDTRCRVFEKIADATRGPGVRSRALAVLDTKRDRMVTFGGRAQVTPGGDDYVVLNDLWNLDLQTRTWGSMRTRGFQPSPRYSAAGGYDEVNDRMIVHGGNTSENGLFYARTGGTYAMNFADQTWELLENADDDSGPGARLNHAGAVDSEGQKLYVYGGSTDFFDPALGDLWALDLTTSQWTEVATTSPTRPDTRFMASMMFDPVSDRLFLFGGHDSTAVGNQNDTWAFDPATDRWENIIPPSVRNQAPPQDRCPTFPVDFVLPNLDAPERRSAHMSAFDSRRGEWLIFGGKTDCGIINDVWIFDPRRLSWTEVSKSTKGESCNRRDDVIQCAAMCHSPAEG